MKAVFFTVVTRWQGLPYLHTVHRSGSGYARAQSSVWAGFTVGISI